VIKVEQALSAVPGFGGATLLQQLSNGPTNSSFLLERNAERFVLRLDKPAARELGLDRENEQEVLSHLATQGLAPPVIYCDLSEGVLLRPFLPGRAWTEQTLNSKESLRRLARLLHRLHGLAPAGAAFDPLGAARRYARQLATPESATVLEKAERLAVELAAWPEPAVLCHNDPVCHNLVESESLALIDWEYAAVGDRYFDLAVILQHHGIDDELSDNFLDSYLGRKAQPGELRHLQKQRDFYQCLLLLWNQAVR
jgi:thiamine kinase